MRVESNIRMMVDSPFVIQQKEKSQPERNFTIKDKAKVSAPDVQKDFLQSKVEQANSHLQTHYTSVQFQLHEKLDRYYVEVVDADTKEVVREIPPKDFLDMIAEMTEFQGLMVDQKV